MKREDLLAVLGLVDPAIAANDLIPILTHYWFTGKNVMAYNDVVAISAPYETEFKGALRGSLLSGILSKLPGENVDFLLEDGNVVIKSGRSKLKVTPLPEDSFIFTFPKVKEDKAALVLTEKTRHALMRAIDICLQSLSRRVSEPQRMGITIIPDGDRLSFYSTDSVTLSAAYVSAKGHGFDGHITLSKLFCETALKLAQRKGIDKVHFYIDSEYAMMVFSDGVKLYGRLVDDPNPPNFAKIVGNYLPKGNKNSTIKIPSGLSEALDRAHLVVQKALEPTTRIKVTEGSNGDMVLRILAKSEHGEATESVKIDDQHPEVNVKIDLTRFRECDLSKFDSMLFDAGCIVLASGGDMYHLIAVQGK